MRRSLKVLVLYQRGAKYMRKSLSHILLMIAAIAVASPRLGAAAQPPAFGPNVLIFNPSMSETEIETAVKAIAAQQVSNQFGIQRYALLFMPGTYGTASNPLIFQVGYYTEVAGLGASPADVVINGSIDVYNQCFGTNCIALDNFWRSLSNLTINVAGGSGCEFETEFWAVSQAAPMRRLEINGLVSLMDYCNGGPDFASGGFIADTQTAGSTIINGSQQQFLVRNSNIDGWTNGVWNQVFSGVTGAPAQSFPNPPYTTLATSPVTRERPFLYLDSAGNYNVFVPAVQTDSSGTTWASGPTAGSSIPISRFFIATPSTSVFDINLALLLGKNLIFTPGVYDLNYPVVITRPDTVVLGLGFATLSPQNGTAAMTVVDAPGVKIAGLLFDAGPSNSPVLLEVGTPFVHRSNPQDPTTLNDVFFRIGGAAVGKATTSLVVNSDNVLLDDIWAWRADHGTGVGWTANTADTGLVVNGDNVTAYGLFVEHYQKFQVIWNGENGQTIMFQNEMPYDPPSQAAWMHDGVDGYAAYKVADFVQTHQGWGLGSYCFFDLGVPIYATDAFEVPITGGVQLHDILTVLLSGSGGIENVVNNTGGPTVTAGTPVDVVSYP
jgi:hypothetical protein